MSLQGSVASSYDTGMPFQIAIPSVSQTIKLSLSSMRIYLKAVSGKSGLLRLYTLHLLIP